VNSKERNRTVRKRKTLLEWKISLIDLKENLVEYTIELAE
jgi:hypothetical protein